MTRALWRCRLHRALRCSVALLACGALTWACDEATLAGPTLDQAFTLAPGESATVHGASMSLQFLRVSSDSRCPADAICLQGGDAIVHVRAAGAVTADYELHTGGPPHAVTTPTGLRIELTQLQPYPFSSRTTQPGDYRATLVVTR